MFSRVKEISWHEFEAFVYAGLCYAWIAQLLSLSGKIQEINILKSLSEQSLVLSQLFYFALTIAFLWYTHQLLKTHTPRVLATGFFAALFFALWSPIHVLLAMVALGSIYIPANIGKRPLVRYGQPLFGFAIVVFIYFHGIALVTNGAESSAGMALRLLSLTILLELAVVHTWYHGTGRGPDLIR